MTASIGEAGEVLLLVLYGKEDTEHRTPMGIFPKIQADQTHDYKVNSYGSLDEPRPPLWIRGERFNFHFVQRLSTGEILLANARCSFNNGNPDRHVRIFDAKGELTRELVLGDGISALECVGGKIWTTFFDEGIFGNFGWIDPIGSCGVIQWDEQGKQLYQFDSEEANFIDDVYATNAVGPDECWIYYYSTFAMLKIKNGEIAGSWMPSVHGAHCMAVAEPYILMNGGYERPHEYDIWKLGPTKGEEYGKLTHVAAIGFDPEDLQGFGFMSRGSLMYFVDWEQHKIYRHDLRQTLEQVAE